LSKVEQYRNQLRALKDWIPYLMKESGLPGPRGNLELAQAVAEEATPKQIETLLSIPAADAPENSTKVFVIFCGVAALGKLVAQGDQSRLARLRAYAGDPRWRIREAVAIALQYYGDADVRGLIREMRLWRRGDWYEKRAAAAALAEPRLLKGPAAARAALAIMDHITADMEGARDSKSDAFHTLRQSLGYCWSVAVAAAPETGKPYMEKWIRSKNDDVIWCMRQNLAKKRLLKMDAAWVRLAMSRLNSGSLGRTSSRRSDRRRRDD
jgi:hypothetical protein